MGKSKFGTPRESVVRARVTDGERAFIEKLAIERGITLSEVLRYLIHREVEREREAVPVNGGGHE